MKPRSDTLPVCWGTTPQRNLSCGTFLRFHLSSSEHRPTCCACSYVANAQLAFDITLEFIKDRNLYGRKVGDFQVNRFKMADMRTEIDITQTFVDMCVMEHNNGELSGDLAARAKLFASELEGRVTDECLQLHGGAGFMDEFRISHLYRNARVSRIYAGTSEVMREIIARSIGLDPRKRGD